MIVLFDGKGAAGYGLGLDCIEVPGNAQTWCGRRDRMAVFNPHGFGGQGIKLRDVFDPACIGHCRTERDMQLHEEMRTHWHIEAFGKMRHF